MEDCKCKLSDLISSEKEDGLIIFTCPRCGKAYHPVFDGRTVFIDRIKKYDEMNENPPKDGIKIQTNKEDWGKLDYMVIEGQMIPLNVDSAIEMFKEIEGIIDVDTCINCKHSENWDYSVTGECKLKKDKWLKFIEDNNVECSLLAYDTVFVSSMNKCPEHSKKD